MTVSCPECRSVFRVDPAKVPATGVRARCSVCGGVMAIAGGTLPVSVTPVTASTAVLAFAGGSSRATFRSSRRLPPAVRPPTPIRQPALVRANPRRAPRRQCRHRREPMDTVPRTLTAAAVPRMPTPAAMPSVSFGVRPPPALPTAPVSAAGPSVTVTSPTPYPVPTMATPGRWYAGRGEEAHQSVPSGRPIATCAATGAGRSSRIWWRTIRRSVMEGNTRGHPARGFFAKKNQESYEEYVEQVGARGRRIGPALSRKRSTTILAGGQTAVSRLHGAWRLRLFRRALTSIAFPLVTGRLRSSHISGRFPPAEGGSCRTRRGAMQGRANG
ncbi:zinc-ribbon domain-containing protein [Gemmatimonas sp.]|uniref:zinc-ribbon domain-containing protein n=1 Tax=Gemmatimonas sp. TaxID=1962908 RepID=UPI003DA1EED2